jgi:hypothetical protein
MVPQSIPKDRRLERVVRMIARDYGNYCQRSEVSFQLANSRKLPSKATDEIRNALDHLMEACGSVFGIKPRRSHRRAGPTSVPLEVARCRRHLVCAQYYCLLYSIELRTKHINKLLKPPFKKTSTDVQRYRKEFEKLLIKANRVRKPLEQPNLTAKQAMSEIRKLKISNARLDTSLNRLDKIYSSILGQDDGKVLLSS